MSSTMPCLAFKTATPVMTVIQGNSHGLEWEMNSSAVPWAWWSWSWGCPLLWSSWNISKLIYSPGRLGNNGKHGHTSLAGLHLYPTWVTHSVPYPPPLRQEVCKVSDSCQPSSHQGTELPSSLTHNEEEHDGLCITKILHKINLLFQWTLCNNP